MEHNGIFAPIWAARRTQRANNLSTPVVNFHMSSFRPFFHLSVGPLLPRGLSQAKRGLIHAQGGLIQVLGRPETGPGTLVIPCIGSPSQALREPRQALGGQAKPLEAQASPE